MLITFSSALLLLCAATAVYLLRLLLQPLFSPLRHVPGPFLARFTDLWYLRAAREANFEKTNIALHRQHGPVVRYGPNRYSICDPLAYKVIYRLGGNQFAKSAWYDAMGSANRMPNLFTDQDAERHAHNRRLYQSTYALTSLISYEPYVDHCADLFSQRLDELAAAAAEVDLGHWLQCYAFDVIGMITYSKRMGFLDAGQDVGGAISALEDYLLNGITFGPFPTLFRHYTKLRGRLPWVKQTGRSKVIDFTMERMREHQANPKSEKVGAGSRSGEVAAEDFLSKFYARHQSSPEVFTTLHVQAGCISNMGAGSDTTAISLSAIMYYLMKHPSCMEKLRAEVDDHHARAESPSRHISFKDSQTMPYLQAVIKEALRVHPAVGLPLERVVPSGGVTVAGQFFPGGTTVGINCWVEHYNPQNFGADAEQFRPERWLNQDQEKLAEMSRHWIPFGLGSRTCIGRHISMLEISKLIPRLVRDFDFELVEPGQEFRTVNVWFVKPKNFTVRVRKRVWAS